VLRVQAKGRERWVTLKAAELEAARAEAAAVRGEMRAGKSPTTARLAAVSAERTFKAVAERWYDRHRTRLTSEAHAVRLKARLDKHTAPIADAEVSTIAPADILDCLRRLERANKHETARRTFQVISAVLDYAVLEGIAPGNAAAPVKRVLLPTRAVPRKALLAGDDIGDALVALASGRHAPLRRALAFQWLTAARTGEVVGATWTEIDFDAGTWTIPAARMKMRRGHVVPLSPQAQAILREAKADRPHDIYVFPGRSRTGPLTLESFARAYQLAGLDAVPHGVRAAFTTWAAGEDMNADVIEACQARITPGVRGRYMRADFLEQKRDVFTQWAVYLDRVEGAARLR
jgi:integrase